MTQRSTKKRCRDNLTVELTGDIARDRKFRMTSIMAVHAQERGEKNCACIIYVLIIIIHSLLQVSAHKKKLTS